MPGLHVARRCMPRVSRRSGKLSNLLAWHRPVQIISTNWAAESSGALAAAAHTAAAGCRTALYLGRFQRLTGRPEPIGGRKAEPHLIRAVNDGSFGLNVV